MKSEQSSVPSSSPTRVTILSAANRVLLTDGVVGLTLDSVAREAGVSKGGLLYHFPSKQALVEGMITAQQEEFAVRLTRELERDSGGDTGRWLRSYARATVADPVEPHEVNAGLLVAVANAPDLLASIRDGFAHWQRLAEDDGLDPALGTLLRLAVEGLWFADLFGLAPPQGVLRREVLDTILDLIGGSVPPDSSPDAVRASP